MLKKTIAGSLICILTFNSLAWVPSALAAEDQGAEPDSQNEIAPLLSRPTYSFSFDIPDHGALDQYHNAYTDRDRISNSLYALRNTAVEDLLNTRQALKSLIGGTERLKEISGRKDLSFDVPGSVIDLYLIGRMGAHASGGRSDASFVAADASGAWSAAAPAQGHGIDTSTIPEISRVIHWIATNEPEYDEKLRARLLLGLAYVSAQLTKFDQQLKFVESDYWNDESIRLEYWNSVLRPAHEMQVRAAALGGVTPPSDLSGSAKRMLKRTWLEEHQMIETISVLAGHREYLLDRYHLLAVKVGGKPLYKALYQAMEKQGFPSAKMVQPVVDKHLPKKGEPIPLPETFEKAVAEAFDKHASKEGVHAFLNRLHDDGNAKIDQALIESLKANSERLSTLTREIDYTGARDSELLALARYEDLWSATLDKYGYLNGVIDLQGAHDELASYFKRRDKTAKRVKWVVYGVGIGIGIAATVASFGAAGTAGTLVGVPLRALLIGSGTITTGQAYLDYVDSSQKAQIAKGLFLGTTQFGSHQDMESALAIRQSDYHFLIGSLVVLGLETRVLSLLAKARPMLQSGGRWVVKITKEELKILKAALARLAPRAELMAPLGRALKSIVQNLSSVATGGTDVFIGAEEAIPMLAKYFRMAPSMVRARMEALPGIGAIIRGARLRNETSKIMARPSFYKVMLQQQAVSFSVGIVTERAARGDAMLGEELPDFINDMTQGALVTFALVYIGSPAAVPNASRVKTQGGFFQDNAFGKIIKQGGQNMLVGLTINGTTTGIRELVQYVKTHDDPNAPSGTERAKTAAINATYGALFMGISSNLRYAGYSWLQNNISRFIKNEPTAKIVLTGASVGNNLFGGWSYVKIAKAVGVMKDGGSTPQTAPEGPAPGEPGVDGGELDPSVTGLAIEDLGGAYFRVEGDQTAADYMFDFLREGDGAGPAPVLE